MGKNEAIFLEQIKDNQRIIYKLVGLYVSDAEEKKDLYQEILLQTWKAWPFFRGEAKFSTWLYRICLNTIFTQKRKRSPIDYRESLEEGLPIDDRGSGHPNAENLQWAIRRLGETDRAILSMNLDGYENGEIAAVMGISNNHVAVKIHRIKQQLTTLLQ